MVPTNQPVSYSNRSIRWGNGYSGQNNSVNLTNIEQWWINKVGQLTYLRKITGVIMNEMGMWQPCQELEPQEIHIPPIHSDSFLDSLAEFCSITSTEINAVDLDFDNNFLLVHADYIVPVYMVKENKSYPMEVPRKFIFTLQ
jgi:hypothetical protein